MLKILLECGISRFGRRTIALVDLDRQSRGRGRGECARWRGAVVDLVGKKRGVVTGRCCQVSVLIEVRGLVRPIIPMIFSVREKIWEESADRKPTAGCGVTF